MRRWNRLASRHLRLWRRRNKISQTLLAKRIGYSENIVKMWEKGSVIPKPILYYALIGLETVMKREKGLTDDKK